MTICCLLCYELGRYCFQQCTEKERERFQAQHILFLPPLLFVHQQDQGCPCFQVVQMYSVYAENAASEVARLWGCAGNWVSQSVHVILFHRFFPFVDILEGRKNFSSTLLRSLGWSNHQLDVSCNRRKMNISFHTYVPIGMAPKKWPNQDVSGPL